MAKILLVEDDNNLREIYEARLQAEGYDIVSANDGESALAVAKNEKPDLIISDVMMPKISGFEMLDILRNTDELRDVKVIMLTALGQADDQARANKLGADRYLVKSQVTLEDIVKVSHELLEGDGGAPAAAPAATVPVAEPAAAPASSSAPAADPVATPIAVTAPPADPVATEPAATEPATTVPAPAADPATQTSASEEATVEKQIENFVAAQPTEAPAAVEPSATPEAPAQPEVTSPETLPSAAQVSDDKVLSSAVDTLVADANEASQAESAPAPSAAADPAPVAPAAEPATTEPAAEDTSASAENVAIAHKKVIQPLDSASDKPDLNALLAMEEAKEAKAAAMAPPEPVVGNTEDEGPSGAPTPPPSSQAEHSGPDKPFDPNSIAL